MKKLDHAQTLEMLSPPDRIRYVANWIERYAEPEGRFDMEDYRYETVCGTVACFAGWTCMLVYGEDCHEMRDWEEEACQILGLRTGSEAYESMTSLFQAYYLDNATALRTFRAIADWMDAEEDSDNTEELYEA